MADRYWVLGTGTWDSTSTTNWSTSSGGAGGASVPTAADNVFFDANSNVLATAFTVTMANTPRVCNDFTASGLDGTMTLAGSGIGLTVSGSLTFQSTNFTRSYTGVTIFNATTTGKTVTANGVAFGAGITFDGVGGAWTLGSALTVAGATNTTTLTNGTLDLASYTLSIGRFSSTNSNTRTIAFGTGQISCTGTGAVWNTSTVTGLTTTGTQVVNVTSVGSTGITVTTGSLSEANSISFNFTGGTYGLDFLATAQTARNVDFTGYAGNWTGPSSAAITIYGNFKVSSGMTLSASTNAMTFGATSGIQQITTNAKTINFPLTFNGIGGTFQLQDALTMGSTRTATLTNGTLDLNGFTYTVGTAFTTATGTKNLTFNGGTLVCPTAATTAFNNAAPTGFTTTAGTGTGTISMTAATAKTFVGGGSTFNCTINQGGAGALTITGSNTFNNITNTVQPASVLFTAGTTSTFTNFSLSGTAGNLITIGSVTAASHTLSKASGTVSSDYLSISRSTAAGGAGWYAGANSTDGGNNTGWSFAAAPGASSGYPYGSGHYGIGPYNIGNLVLSGNQATGAVGTLLADRSIQEDGTIATGNVGTVGISRTVAITGNAATCAVGSVLAASTQAITGNASTLSVGSVTQSASIDLVGNASTAAVGTVGLTSTKAVTGNVATGDVGTVLAEVISFQAITGVEGTGAVGTASNVISIGIIGVESICAVGIMIGFGWGSIPNTSETWTPEADTSESWTPVANSTESWTPASDTSESWSDLADNSITWQEAA